MSKGKPPETDDAPDPMDDILAGLSESIGDNRHARIMVQRKGPDGEWRHVCRYSPEDFDVEAIREDYGGGEFRARVQNQKGQWIGAVQRFSIEGAPLEPDAVQMALRKHRGRDDDRERGGSSREDRVFDMLLAMLSRPTPPPPPPPAPVDFTGFATALAEAQTRGMAQLAEIVNLKKELGRGDGEMTMFEAFREGMALARELERSDTGYGELIKGLSPLIERLSEGDKAAVPSRETQAKPAAPPAEQPSAVGQAFAHLLSEAESGNDTPEAWGAVLVAKLPTLADELEAQIAEAGGIEAFMVHMGRLEPRAVRHAEYFFAAICEILDIDPDETAGTLLDPDAARGDDNDNGAQEDGAEGGSDATHED